MNKRKIVCKDTKEIVYSYKDYLKTEHWKKERSFIAKKRKYTCQKCGIVNKKHFNNFLEEVKDLDLQE